MKLMFETNWHIKLFHKDSFDKNIFIPFIECISAYTGKPIIQDAGLFITFAYNSSYKSKFHVDHKAGTILFEDGISGKTYVLMNNISTRNSRFRESSVELERIFSNYNQDDVYLILQSHSYLRARSYNYYNICIMDKEVYDMNINDDIQQMYSSKFNIGLNIKNSSYFELKLKDNYLNFRNELIKSMLNVDDKNVLIKKVKSFIELIESREGRL